MKSKRGFNGVSGLTPFPRTGRSDPDLFNWDNMNGNHLNNDGFNSFEEYEGKVWGVKRCRTLTYFCWLYILFGFMFTLYSRLPITHGSQANGFNPISAGRPIGTLEICQQQQSDDAGNEARSSGKRKCHVVWTAFGTRSEAKPGGCRQPRWPFVNRIKGDYGIMYELSYWMGATDWLLLSRK